MMISELPIEDFTAYLQRDSNKAHLAYMAGRIGAGALVAAIEWTWFKPGTIRNDLLDIHAVKFHRMPFLVCSFPMIKLRDARHLARRLGVRIVDGAPTILTVQNSFAKAAVTSRPSRRAEIEVQGFKADFFPGAALTNGTDNMAVFTIENDRNSPIYKNKVRDEDAMHSAESEIIDILNKGVVLSPAQIADYIYGSGPFPNPD